VTGRTKTAVLVLAAMLAALLLLAASAARADMVDSAGMPPWEHCALCHGLDGVSRMAKFPKLAGQPVAYLVKQLMDFRSGARDNDSGPMTGIVHQFEPPDLRRAAGWFAALPPPAADAGPVGAEIAKTLFERGRGAAVPACRICHGAAAKTAFPAPRLEAQHARYLEKQLGEFRDGARANDPDGVMRRIAGALSEAEIGALARWLAARPRDPEAAP
jgi:cytochrome c553